MSHAIQAPPWERELHESKEDILRMMQTYKFVLRSYLDTVGAGDTLQHIAILQLAFRRFDTAEPKEMSILLTLHGQNWIVSNDVGWTFQSSSLEKVYQKLQELGIDNFIPVDVSSGRPKGLEYEPQYFPLIVERAMRRFVFDRLEALKPVVASLQQMTSIVEDSVRLPRYASTQG